MPRQSKRLHWEIMIQLEEAGEEDICSLLNQVTSLWSDYGTGDDLKEYLEALSELEAKNELQVQEYRKDGPYDFFLGVVTGGASRPPDCVRIRHY